MRRAVLVLLPLALLPACRSDEVPLSYRLEPGLRLEHRLTLRAEVTRTLSGETRELEVEASFRATQDLLGTLEGGGVEAAISLVPEG
ncbi:MAG: hypothetical protein ACRD0S_13935, partial [Acidimicrobiales bacterium]